MMSCSDTNLRGVKIMSISKKSAGVKYIEQKYGVTAPDLSEHGESLYSIYDKVQKIFLPPFPAPTVEACMRSIKDVVIGQPTSLMAKYPSDYDVYYLAEWNNDTGYISFDVPQRITSVFDLVSRKESNENEVQHKV